MSFFSSEQKYQNLSGENFQFLQLKKKTNKKKKKKKKKKKNKKKKKKKNCKLHR